MIYRVQSFCLSCLYWKVTGQVFTPSRAQQSSTIFDPDRQIPAFTLSRYRSPPLLRRRHPSQVIWEAESGGRFSASNGGKDRRDLAGQIIAVESWL
ncbi:hypothetical protein QWA68_011822 [Fusarium oxysporum]|nr:hypothetical protein QWA68_011822 [Fusarium oxysporum]